MRERDEGNKSLILPLYHQYPNLMKIPKTCIISLVILSWMPNNIFGQLPKTKELLVLTFANNAFRVGDACELEELKLQKDIFNLSEAQSLRKQVKEHIKEYAPDTIVCLRGSNRYYYRNERNAQYLIGTENNQEVMWYDIPEQTIEYPFLLHVSICGYFHGTGKFCDRLFLRKYGNYKTLYEQQASLILPNDNTIEGAAVVRTIRLLGTLSAPIDTISQREDYNLDRIQKELANNPSLEKEEVTKFYIRGYRYPIVEAFCKREALSDSVIYQHIFYRSPEEQESLPLDENNLKIRRDFLNQEYQEVSSDYANIDNRENRTYQVSYDNSCHQLSIDSSRSPESDILLILSDSQGRVYKRSKEKMPHGIPIVINCVGMPTGQYVLYIYQDLNTISIEKFNIK